MFGEAGVEFGWNGGVIRDLIPVVDILIGLFILILNLADSLWLLQIRYPLPTIRVPLKA